MTQAATGSKESSISEIKSAHGYSPKHAHQPIIHPLKNSCHIYCQVTEDTARIATGGRVRVGCWLKRSDGCAGYRKDKRKTAWFEKCSPSAERRKKIDVGNDATRYGGRGALWAEQFLSVLSCRVVVEGYKTETRSKTAVQEEKRSVGRRRATSNICNCEVVRASVWAF